MRLKVMILYHDLQPTGKNHQTVQELLSQTEQIVCFCCLWLLLYFSPWLRGRWRPRGGDPARVEDVGLEAAPVASRWEGGADAPPSRGAAAIGRFLQGEQAGGGGQAAGV